MTLESGPASKAVAPPVFLPDSWAYELSLLWLNSSISQHCWTPVPSFYPQTHSNCSVADFTWTHPAHSVPAFGNELRKKSLHRFLPPLNVGLSALVLCEPSLIRMTIHTKFSLFHYWRDNLSPLLPKRGKWTVSRGIQHHLESVKLFYT